MKKNFRDHFATIMGFGVAIAEAWVTIDWANFDISKEWPKLALSALIAIGGIVSKVKKVNDANAN